MRPIVSPFFPVGNEFPSTQSQPGGALLGVVLVLAFMSGFGSRSFAAPTGDDYANRLIDDAVRSRLSQDRYWHLLLHYKSRLLGGFESQEDGPDFFLSPNGKTDPEAELIATIRSFFRDPQGLNPVTEHPQCTFPARYKWLKTRLSFDPGQLIEQPCPRLGEWLRGLEPQGITLIFSSYYMNNPASMFGHTFLRIDRARTGSTQALLDYGVDYAAAVDTNNALLYALKGLFGFFPGRFSIIPYYTKVQEYGNWESRDLWEYELNFTEDQLHYLLLHLWELGGNYFDYLYVQENCSYHILSILEVGNPDLHLTDPFSLYVIPADTVKVVAASPGFVRRRVYRPSLLSQMNQKRIAMSDAESEAFRRLAHDPSWLSSEDSRSLSDRGKARVLDAYLDYRQFRDLRAGRQADAISPETRRFQLERSQLPTSDEARSSIEFSAPPELGHDSARLGAAGGVDSGDPFAEIRIRPAFHDLLAKDIGYGRDSQILFADLAVRYYDRSSRIRLDRLQVIDVLALTPYDPLFRPLSFHLGLGIDTIRDIDCGLCNAARFDYGFGLAYRTGVVSRLRLYSLVDFAVESSPKLDRSYRLGGALQAGVLLDVGDNWRFQVTSDYFVFLLGHRSSYPRIGFSQRYAVSTNLDFRLVFDRIGERRQWSLGANVYF